MYPPYDLFFVFPITPQPPRSTLFPYTTLFRSTRPPPPASASPSRRSQTCSAASRSEEHTSELQSLRHLVCRLLLEKKQRIPLPPSISITSRRTTSPSTPNGDSRTTA